MERFASDLARQGHVTVKRDVKVRGQISGRMRQIDVLATGTFAGAQITVIYEAKCYAGKIQIGTVDELAGKAEDVAAEHAILCAPLGFSEGALARARGTVTLSRKIGVAHLSADWPEAVQGERLSRTPPSVSREFRHSPPVAYQIAALTGSPAKTSPPQYSTRKATADYVSFLRGAKPLYVTA
ncbi:Restriction endonuclease [Actinacidiphila paucisporea]|uniref:Restriction endonuclease n=1 Tax=Actinacidiphila paucisporea TaxID=310782 RepID=A0A1M6TG52_9ACTN|nr:Restriction endonuclease [Actinacidiphila paucisporea]